MKLKVNFLIILFLSLLVLNGYSADKFKFNNKRVTYAELDYGYPIKTLDLGGNYGKVAYIDTERGTKTFVMLHGIGSYTKHWIHQMKALQPEYRIVALDMPGYGKSGFSARTAYNIQFHGNAVWTFINKLKLKNVILAGHSYGANVVIEMSSYSQLDLLGMVLVAPQGLQDLSYQDYSYYDSNLPSLLKYDFDISANIDVWFDFLIKKRTPVTDEFLQELLGLIHSGDYRGTATVRERVLLFQQKKRYNKKLIWKFLKFKKPILLVMGENDKLVPGFEPSKMRAPTPKEFFPSLVKKNPQCKLIFIEDCGHMVPIEYPNELSEMMKKFASSL